MNILCNTLLPNDKVQAMPADFGKIIKPLPVIDRVIEINVAPMITTLSIDSNTVYRVLKFLYLFFDLLFLSLKKVILSLILFMWLSKLYTSFSFFSSLCSKLIFSNGALGIIYLFFGPFII